MCINGNPERKHAMGKIRSYIRRGIAIFSVVFALIIVLMALTANSIISLSKSNLDANSKKCTAHLEYWTAQVLSELGIYKEIIENHFPEEKELNAFLKSTYQRHEAYPMGIYVGDDKGLYLDASGWVPGEDWVLEERPWYIAGKNSDDFVFCEPYRDAQLGIVCTSISARLRYDKAVRVMSTDVYIDYANQLSKEIMDDGKTDGALLVTGKSRTILADSGTSVGGDVLSERGKVNDFYQILNKFLDNDKLGQSVVKAKDDTYYVDINYMENSGWYLITFVKRSTLLAPLWKTFAIMAVFGVLAVILLTLITGKIAMSMVEMDRKAKTDQLTALLNRDGLSECLQTALERHPGQGILMICDLDNFKSINDTFGHPVGDKALIQFANLLESYFNRQGDFVARIGGDEFVVFIGRAMKKEYAGIMVEKFVLLVRQKFEADYPGLQVSVSIGGVFVGAGQDENTLYELADSALYDVKQNGKDNYKLLEAAS